MKKFYLVALMLFISCLSFGQANEIEPNNSFATANVVQTYPDTTYGTLGGADVVDYFKPDIDWLLNYYTHGNYVMILTVTNTGISSSQFNVKMYNSNQGAGLVYEENVDYQPMGIINTDGTQDINIPAGATVTQYIRYCGQALDSMYFVLSSTGNFSYHFQTYLGNVVKDVEPNNTRSQAAVFFTNVEVNSGIEYTLINGQPQKDTVDYHKIVFDNLTNNKLRIEAQNNSCSNNQKIHYDLFKNDELVPYSSGYVGNDSLVGSYYEVHSYFDLNNFIIGDSLTIKITASAAFRYDFKVGFVGSGGGGNYDDPEDNCCYYNAITMPENTTMYGNVGLYDYNLDEYVDEFDTYKIVLPQAGDVFFTIAAETQECLIGDQYLYYDILDANGDEISTYNSMLYMSDPDCNSFYGGSFTDPAWEAGTYYIRLYTQSDYQSSALLNYELSYSFTNPVSFIDPEPNNTKLTATPVNIGDTIIGRIAYKQLGSYGNDDDDLYKVNTPGAGTLKIYIKNTYLGYSQSNYSGSGIYFYSSPFPSKWIPSPTQVPNLVMGTTYYDTVTYCNLAPGDHYFYMSGYRPYNYEIITEFIPDNSLFIDAEPNNSFETAILLNPGDTSRGNIAYVNDGGSRDATDYYKIPFTSKDSLILKFKATSKSCITNNRLSVSIYNKNKTNLTYRTLAGNSNVASGQIIEDSIKILINAPDSIYVRMEGYEGFEYQFVNNFHKPTSLFTISGDTTACLGIETYTARNLNADSVGYHWSLPDGGGTITWVDSVATVNWNSTGSKRVQLYLSNKGGVSATKNLNVVVSNLAPTQTPLAFNFSRNLSTQSVPLGTYPQWFNNDVPIVGATDSMYYAANAGTFTVKFMNECGAGPASNSYTFPAAAQVQNITFTHTSTLTMAPALTTVLQATSNSNLPVSFQKVSGPATVNNDSLFITGAGTIIIKATQPGDDIYLPATPKFDTIIVIKGNQTISLDSIPDLIYNDSIYYMTASSSTGQTISYYKISGPVTVYSYLNRIYKTGVGQVTVEARQTGNANYNAATPVSRTFCIGIRYLKPITGVTNPCLNTYTYVTEKIPGANFVWTLSGGGILTTNNDTAWVQWQTPGTHTIKVKANSPCDPIFSNEQSLEISTSADLPQPVSNMLPVNHIQNQQLPLQLSWIPGANSVNYDLYIWDSAGTQPATPYAANLTSLTFSIPKNTLAFNKTYKWRLVSKNPCTQTPGPIQHFSLIPLPDLMVSNITIPSNVNSGQTITISYSIKNIGPGNTTTNQSWNDAVFLSFDTMPNFVRPPELRGPSWSTTQIPIRPLLLGTKQNVSALDSGQSYTNSVSFDVPLSYSQPLYVYVISNYGNYGNKPLQVTKLNDTARATGVMNVTLTPTPDLRIDTVFTPSQSFSGSKINVTYKVKNYGVLTPAGSKWDDKVYISQSLLFNEDDAIELKIPSYNNVYYPNTSKAIAKNNAQLLAGDFYTKNIEVELPNFIFGSWFVHVKTNFDAQLYEGALANNNVNNNPIQIYLTPTPKLTVGTINVPVTTASTTQPIGASWNIKNEGSFDNREANQGHYLTNIISRCPCSVPHGSPPGSVCIGSPVFKDSTSWGSSYWVDKIYLSTNPNALIPAQAILLKDFNQGTKPFAGLDFINFNNCSNPSSAGAHNVLHALKPNGNYPGSLNFAIPDSLTEGNYYVYVHTNATKSVFEYPGTAQIKRSDAPISILNPDVEVPEVLVPANVSGGQNFTLTYKVLNSGAGSIFNHIRRDRIYVSNFPNFDGNAQLIGEQSFTENIASGAAVSHQFTYAFAPAASGNKYFYVHTNYDASFKETNANNNRSVASAPLLVTAATPADLIVASIQLADTVTSLVNNSFIYTVNNIGTGNINANWTDSLFVSCNPTFNRSNSYYAGKKLQNRILNAGGNFTDTMQLNLSKMPYDFNSCFPKLDFNNAYFFIKTNANNNLYEGANVNNNISGSGNRVIKNLMVDQIVTQVQAPLSYTTADRVNVNFTVKNIGLNPNNNSYYNNHWDAVYFSPDSVLNSNAVLADYFVSYDKLNPEGEKIKTKTIVVPNIPTGDYYLHVKTNYSDAIKAELIINNNSNVLRNAQGAAIKVQVVRPILPDLVDSILYAPAIVAPGQPFQIIRRIKNIGAGVTSPSNFTNRVWLSANLIISSYEGDNLISNNYRTEPLLPGAYYDDTVTAQVPGYQLEGNYYLIGHANAYLGNNVYESNMENNYSYKLIAVIVPPASDLIVTNITLPDTLLLGYNIDSTKWVVNNESSNTAKGYTKDGFYLSPSPVFDSAAVLMGVKSKNINMQPLQSDSISLSSLLQNVIEGDYYAYVKTDLLNNIVETDKDNNLMRLANTVHVKIKELPLNVLTNNTLHTVPRYYKMVLPDSLIGATIKVTLKTTDSNLVRNEMYIASGYIPYSGKFDYRFEIPNYGNQQIVISDVVNTEFYLTVLSASPNAAEQNITLFAEKLPFAIATVQTNAGANIGNVTVKISGSLFKDSMQAKLTKGATVINATKVYFVNSTTVFATFPLQGKELGVYNVTLTKTDATEAVLPNGFSIVTANNGGLITGGGNNTGSGNGNDPGCDPGAASGLNSQLVVELVAPPKVVTNWPFIIQINYNNPTNYDIPTQTKILYSEADLKLAFTAEGVATGTTSLYLEFSEAGGPPGIIRAGGSGTITVHTKSPGRVPINPIVLFKLK